MTLLSLLHLCTVQPAIGLYWLLYSSFIWDVHEWFFNMLVRMLLGTFNRSQTPFMSYPFSNVLGIIPKYKNLPSHKRGKQNYRFFLTFYCQLYDYSTHTTSVITSIQIIKSLSLLTSKIHFVTFFGFIADCNKDILKSASWLLTFSPVVRILPFGKCW